MRSSPPLSIAIGQDMRKRKAPETCRAHNREEEKICQGESALQ